MPAQNFKPSGVFGAIAGLLGLSVLAGILVTAMITPAIAVTGMTAKSSIGIFNSLPDYLTLDAQAQKNTIYGVDNAGTPVPIAQIYRQNREEIKWADVNDNVKNALLAAEDRKFYEHGGINVSSTIRAALSNVLSNDIESGASTITMQLVKNIYIMRALEEKTEAERTAALEEAQVQTIDRKLKEMKLAIGLEKRYTKNEIMLGYLNIAGFGNNTYGIEAAANRFFSVSAKDLTLPQAASLIAIVQTPTYHSLNNPDNFERNQARRDLILKNMLKWDFIDQAAFDEAIATPLEVVPSDPKGGCLYAAFGNYYCDYVTWLVPELESLGSTPEERQANWDRGGYHVYTALDVEQQQNAEARLAAEAPPEEARFELGAAASAVQPGTGKIMVMAQNKRFNNTEDDDPTTTAVNFNTDHPYGGSSGFQVGSTYKIFTLAEWLKEGHGLNETVDGRVKTYDQGTFKASCASFAGSDPWKVPNYGGAGGSASTSVMSATRNSINSAYVAMAHKLDLCAIRDTALAMGVHRADGNELKPDPSAILGINEIAPLSLASAFATVASGGVYCKPIAVVSIVNAQGKELPGQTPECESVLTPEVASAMVYALQSVMSGGGTGSQGNPGDGIPIFGKTGTNDAAVHTWLAGATSNMALAVWVGNIIGKQNLERVSLPGGRGNAARYRLFKNIMGALNGEYGGNGFPEVSSTLLAGQTVTVPDVTGQTREQAATLLESLGFTPEWGGDVSSSMSVGKVARTIPGAGSKVSSGTVISFYTSIGNMISMPDVTGRPFGAAKAELGSSFTNVVEDCTVLSPGDSKLDKVVASNPAPGAEVIPSDPVTLTVGKLICP